MTAAPICLFLGCEKSCFFLGFLNFRLLKKFIRKLKKYYFDKLLYGGVFLALLRAKHLLNLKEFLICQKVKSGCPLPIE